MVVVRIRDSSYQRLQIPGFQYELKECLALWVEARFLVEVSQTSLELLNDVDFFHILLQKLETVFDFIIEFELNK